jgi:capsular polysaccharide biosynthesis protein
LQEERELELQDYLRVIRRRLWTIVWVTVVAVVVSGFLSFFVIKPTYQAQATLIVVNKSTPVVDQSTFMLDEQLVQTYATLGTSYGVLEHAILAHNIPYPEPQLSKLLTVTAVTNTDLVTVAADGKSAVQAAGIANDVAQSLAFQAKGATPGYYVSVVDAAVPPTTPVSPNKKLNVTLAFVLGILVGLGVAFLQEYFDRSIHDPEQLAREIGIPVLASVPVIDDAIAQVTRHQSGKQGRMRA